MQAQAGWVGEEHQKMVWSCSQSVATIHSINIIDARADPQHRAIIAAMTLAHNCMVWGSLHASVAVDWLSVCTCPHVCTGDDPTSVATIRSVLCPLVLGHGLAHMLFFVHSGCIHTQSA